MSELIQKDLDNGCIYGPFCKPAFEHYRVSPLGVTTGKYSHKKRLILDLSVPHSDDVASINDFIDKGQCSMSYIKIDDAVKIITKYGQGTKLCKFDIQNDFKICPVFAETMAIVLFEMGVVLLFLRSAFFWMP